MFSTFLAKSNCKDTETPDQDNEINIDQDFIPLNFYQSQVFYIIITYKKQKQKQKIIETTFYSPTSPPPPHTF